jgi:mono-ADP-ribosyltransferase sirtuin 6
MAFSAHKTAEAMQEIEDSPEVLAEKLDTLAAMVNASRYFVAYTGAGVSTSAGIPDFRGPEGVWTLEAQGRKRTAATTPCLQARPTLTHMALVTLERQGILKHLISSNCDGIHRKSGFDPTKLTEVHGNGNMEECEDCHTRYYRDLKCHRLQRGRDHYTGRHCPKCNGRLLEWTIDFGQNLPEDMLASGFEEGRRADLTLCLGSSLTVSPSCDMPRATAKKRGGKLVVVNLQRTPLDDLCALRIFARTDTVIRGLMERLGVAVVPWTLKRRIALSVEGSTLVLRGVDAFQDGLRATLFKSVTVGRTKKTADPLVFTGLDAEKKGVHEVHLEWQGHYAEPDYCLRWPAGQQGQWYVSLSYDPDMGSWHHDGVVAAPRSCLEDILPWKAFGAVYSPGAADNLDMWMSATAVGSRTVLVGGRAHAGPALYDAATGAVHTAALPNVFEKPRWGHSTVLGAAPDTLVTFGGWDSESQYNDVREINLSTGVVREITTTGVTPPHMAQHGACVLGTKMYVFGGAYCSGGPYVFSSRLLELDLISWRWKDLTPDATGRCPSARAQCAMAVKGTTLLVCGGCNSTQQLNDSFFYDVSTRTWTTGPLLPFPASTLTPEPFRVPGVRPALCVTDAGAIVLWCEAGAFRLVDSVWQKAAAPNTPGLVGHCVVQHGSCVYAFGGRSSTLGAHGVSVLEV